MKDNLSILHSKLLEILIDFDNFCKEKQIAYTLAYGSVLGAIRHQGFIPWDDDLDVYMTAENYHKFLTLFKNTDKYYLQKDTVDYPLQFSKLRCNNTAFFEKIKYRKKYRQIHQGIYIDIFPLDKVQKNKIKRFFQIIFSNILTAQSLFLRGYQTKNVLKYLCMVVSCLFLPLRMRMLEYVRKFNETDDFDYYCDFFGETKKFFLPRKMCEVPFTLVRFEEHCFPVPNNVSLYLQMIYGNYMQLPPKEKCQAEVHALFFSVDISYKEFLNKVK